MLAYIKAETLDILNKVDADLSGFIGKEIGTCPLCGQPVLATDNFFRCAKYKKGDNPCTFVVRREARGAKLTDVVKFTIFLTDINDFSQVNEVMAAHVPTPYPARSCMQVAALPKGALVEVEAIAVI